MSTATSPPVSMFPEGDASFRDGLGLRHVSVDPLTGDRVERLCLSAEIARHASAVEDRLSRLLNFRHARFPRVRGVEVEKRRDGTSTTWVIADPVDGIRVIDLLRLAEQGRLAIDVNTILQLVREVLPALATLHDSRDVTHGAIGPERLVLTPQGRVVIADHVFGAALAKLQYPRVRLWRDFRIAMPPAAGVPRFDARADVAMVATTVLALLLGRPITLNEYPDHLRSALDLAREYLGSGPDRPLSASLRSWLERTLPIDTRKPLMTALQAQVALEEVVKKERAYAPGASALRHFLERVGPVLVAANWGRAPEGWAVAGPPTTSNGPDPVPGPKRPAARPGTRPGPRRLSAEEEEAEEIAFLERELARMAAEEAAARAAQASAGGTERVAEPGSPEDITRPARVSTQTDEVAPAPAVREAPAAVAGDSPEGAAGSAEPSDITLEASQSAGSAAVAPAPEPSRDDSGADEEVVELTRLLENLTPPSPAPPRKARARTHKPRTPHNAEQGAPAAMAPGKGEPGAVGTFLEVVHEPVARFTTEAMARGGVAEVAAGAAGSAGVTDVAQATGFGGAFGPAVVHVISEVPRRLPTTPVIEIVEFDESQVEAAPADPPAHAGVVDAVPADVLPAGAVVDGLWSVLAFHPADVEFQPAVEAPARAGTVDPLPVEALPFEALEATLWSALAFHPAAVEHRAPAEPPAHAGVVDAIPADALPPGAVADGLWSALAFHPAAVEFRVAVEAPACAGVVDPLPVEALPIEALEAFLWSAVAFQPASVEYRRPAEPPAGIGLIDDLPVDAAAPGCVPDDLWSALAFHPASVEFRPPVEVPARAGVVEPLPVEAVPLEALEGILWSAAAFQPAFVEYRRPPEPPERAGIVEAVPANGAPREALDGVLWSPAAFQPADVEYRQPVEAPPAAGAVELAPNDAHRPEVVEGVLWADVAFQPAFVEFREPVRAPGRAGAVQADPAAAMRREVVDGTLWAATAFQPASVEYRLAVEPPPSAGAVDAAPDDATLPQVTGGFLWSSFAYQHASVDYREPAPPPATAGAVDEDPGNAARPEVAEGILWSAAAFQPAFVPFEAAPPAPAHAGVVDVAPADIARPEVVQGILWSALAYQPAFVEYRLVAVPPGVGAIDAEPEEAAPEATAVPVARTANDVQRGSCAGAVEPVAAPPVGPTGLAEPAESAEPGKSGESEELEESGELEESQESEEYEASGESEESDELEESGESEELEELAALEGPAVQPDALETAPSPRVTDPAEEAPMPEHAPWLTSDPLPLGASEFHATSDPATPPSDYTAPETSEGAALVPVASPVTTPVAPAAIRLVPAAEPTVGIRLAPPVEPARPGTRSAQEPMLTAITAGDMAPSRDLSSPPTLQSSSEVSTAAAGPLISGGTTIPAGSGWRRPVAASVAALLMAGGAFGAYWYVRPSMGSAGAQPTSTEAAAPVPVARSGRLKVTSTPAGARVRLDGQDRGVTPLDLADVPAGNHTVVLESESGVVRKTIRVVDGETAHLDASIFSGWLTVFAPFRVRLYADGALLGTSEDGKLLVPSGTHKLELVNEELGVREVRTVEISPGGTTPLSFQAPNGLVEVDAPAGTEVWVDGELKGTLPTGPIPVPVGTHEVLLRHPEAGGRPQTVQVVANRSTRVSR